MTKTNKITLDKMPRVSVNNYLPQAMNNEVRNWINSNLKNYLIKILKTSPNLDIEELENKDEIEHIIDYLNSPEAPSRLQKMSYMQANENSKKWLKTQIKKGRSINEAISDYQIFLDFEDGFKFIKLVGEKSYKKEGFLMSHCVASYYKRSDSEIYSLRDKNNNPHATIEVVRNRGKIEQIKGKGNGVIHPLYANYILDFIRKINLRVSKYDFQRFGYELISNDLFEKVKNIKGLSFFSADMSNYLYTKSVPQNLNNKRLKLQKI